VSVRFAPYRKNRPRFASLQLVRSAESGLGVGAGIAESGLGVGAGAAESGPGVGAGTVVTKSSTFTIANLKSFTLTLQCLPNVKSSAGMQLQG
jgi:hypothetical protein